MNRQASIWKGMFVASLALSACAACARAPDAPGESSRSPTANEGVTQQALPTPAVKSAAAVSPVSALTQELPSVVVHKSASCGCCGSWVEHMRSAGFQVDVHNTDNLNPIKESVGVPVAKGSCHTAQVGGYFIEGHVPASDIKRLLQEKPDAKGLVLPGMPMCSPGMETPDGRAQAYTVELVHRDGSTTAYAEH